jgi:hypothetical protein
LISGVKFAVMTHLKRSMKALIILTLLGQTSPAPAQQNQVETPSRALTEGNPSTQKHSLEELAAEANKHSFQDILNKNPAAISNLEDIFAVTSQVELKQRIASILMRIGVRDSAYFDFLVGEAKKALEIDAPWGELFDDKTGKVTGINPAFLEWCRKHHRNPYEAFEEARYEVPVPWFYLAAAGDPRAYDLLMNGLQAENIMIAALAAQGLAKLQDPRAINELITLSRHGALGIRFQMAEALWFFADPRAQAAADAAAELFLQDTDAVLGRKISVAEIRDSYTKGGPKKILSFEGLLAPGTPLMPPSNSTSGDHP